MAQGRVQVSMDHGGMKYRLAVNAFHASRGNMTSTHVFMDNARENSLSELLSKQVTGHLKGWVCPMLRLSRENK